MGIGEIMVILKKHCVLEKINSRISAAPPLGATQGRALIIMPMMMQKYAIYPIMSMRYMSMQYKNMKYMSMQ